MRADDAAHKTVIKAALPESAAPPDEIVVADGRVVTRRLGKKAAIIEGAGAEGATNDVVRAIRGAAILDDDQALDLAEIGAKVAADAGRPQEISWTLHPDDSFEVTEAHALPDPPPPPAVPAKRDRFSLWQVLALVFAGLGALLGLVGRLLKR
jgi:hypothetical protein